MTVHEVKGREGVFWVYETSEIVPPVNKDMVPTCREVTNPSTGKSCTSKSLLCVLQLVRLVYGRVRSVIVPLSKVSISGEYKFTSSI